MATLYPGCHIEVTKMYRGIFTDGHNSSHLIWIQLVHYGDGQGGLVAVGARLVGHTVTSDWR